MRARDHSRRLQGGRWPVWRLALVFWPLAFGAMTVNVHFLALLGRAVGGPILTPWTALALGAATGVPAAFAFALWIRRLMDRADASD
ncbi:MAG: hypothetical protein COY86_01935 [Rhodobacterales bacterium CG_4_10_14_0_8_um_filter_70_9]|nr:MAG: hypothetical protein COY86_01935 [Rhodobacterales bacterium CG_4_10_14_0_8_um_filter_70_9]